MAIIFSQTPDNYHIGPLTISSKGALLFVWAIIVFYKIVYAQMVGTLGQIGQDSDDVMRLVQLRDFYLGGQNWFDMHQYRMGASQGTLMHWSRLADLPLIILIWGFDLFMPYASAEALAISLWPPLSGLLVIWGVTRAAGFLAGKKAMGFGLILSGLFVLHNIRFSPGAIDHHNLQLGLLSLSIAYALDPDYKARSAVICALALALSIAIAAEIYVYGAIICLFVAVLWIVKGSQVSRFATTFGLTLALCVSAAFIAVTAPQNYNLVQCDTLSAAQLIAALSGGLGLAGLVFFLSGRLDAAPVSIKARLGGAILLGGGCALLLTIIAPQCAVNPLDALPSIVSELWLGDVIEAQSLFATSKARLASALFFLGIVIIALIFCLNKLYANLKKNMPIERAEMGAPSSYAFLAVLLLAAILLTIYQVRFYPFGHIIALSVLPALIALAYGVKRKNGQRSLIYIAVFTISMPVSWLILGLSLSGAIIGASAKDKTIINNGATCYSDTVISKLASLPAGRVSTTSNGTAKILKSSPHAVLSGNYHRNAEGIYQNLMIFTQSPRQAKLVLAKNNIDYVLICRTALQSVNLQNYYPNGLMGQLVDGAVPAYLVPIMSDIEGGAVTIYKFEPNMDEPSLTTPSL